MPGFILLDLGATRNRVEPLIPPRPGAHRVRPARPLLLMARMRSIPHPEDRKSPAQQPLVSVIVPAYDSDAFILGAVESVLEQTLTAWELIVIDDGSERADALDAALAPHRHRLDLIRQPNAGVSAARNAGILAARGRYLAFLDSDDGWEPTFLATQVGILEADPTVTLAYCDATLRGDPAVHGRRVMEFSPSQGPADLHGLVTQRCTVITSCAVTRRDAVLAAGLFDTTLTVSEDFDLWLRLLLAGGRFSYHTEPLGWRTARPGSLSRDDVRMNRAGMAILRAHMEALSRTPAVEEAARATIRTLDGMSALILGKAALLRHELPLASNELDKAYRLLGGLKLGVVRSLMSVAPGLVARMFRLRSGFPAM